MRVAREAPLGAVVAGFTSSLLRRGPYRPPRPDEVTAVPTLADALAGAEGPETVWRRVALAGEPLGLAPTIARDAATGRRHLVLTSDPGSERSWLLVATDGLVPRVIVEVPHPRADLHTDVLGLEVLRELRGALYLQAGAHRVAGGPPGVRARRTYPADVAARPDAVFSRLADALVARLGVGQLQLHGFAERPGRDVDVVVSPGAAPLSDLAAALRARLGGLGERVRAPGDGPGYDDLAGRRNVQGLSAARRGSAFVHVELSRALRADRCRVRAVGAALAAAVRDTGGAGSGGAFGARP